MLGMLPALETWSSRHGLTAFGNRLKPGAYYGCVSMPEEVGARLMASYSLWLFALDACTDESPSLEALEARARKLLPPLVGQPRPEEGATELETRLATSWEELRSELLRLRGPALDAASLAFSVSTFTAETAAVVGAMCWERQQSLRYLASTHRTAPFGLDEYLTVSRYSICVRSAGSLALAFEPSPLEAWSRWQRAMDAGARVLRLVNDLANIQKEFEEGKLNAVSLTLLGLGWDGRTTPPADSPLLAEAILQVRKRLAEELDRFSDEVHELPSEGPLATNVLASVAFTIAMYQHGDYEIPLEHGAF